MIPEWMKEVGPSNCCTVSVDKKKSFVEKTISGILNFFQESLISEGYTKRNGFLQSIDPRVKLISLLFLIKRVWVFVPIFVGIFVLPIIFSVFMAGDNLVTIATLGSNTYIGPFLLPSTIYITKQGTISAATFILRVATCVSLTVLLVLTTKRFVLFQSLRSLHIPKVYVLTLDMCYTVSY